MSEQKEPKELFESLWERRGGEEVSAPSSGLPGVEAQTLEPSITSPSDLLDEINEEEQEASSAPEEESAVADKEDVDNEVTDLLSQPSKSLNDSEDLDIEKVFVKGVDGRKQPVNVNYSDRKAIKKAFIQAAGMRKFQAERDKALKTHQTLTQEYDGLKKDFEKIEKAFEEHGAKGIVELLGGEESWQKAVDEELSHREYLDNLTAEEKYQLEIKKRDEQYQKKLQEERLKREEFQKKIEEKESQADLQKLESKLHPAFDRYRFAGKLGDPTTENLYDEAIWSKVKERLAEYPDTVDLNQAVIDKEFRTVANLFRKHIKAQTEKKVKTTVDKKKTETAKRAQLAAKKSLSGNSQQRKILQSLRNGDLGGALSLWKS